MQKLVAYLLERRDGLEIQSARQREAARLQTEILGWLASKGASAPGPTGTYQPLDGSVGTFEISQAVDEERSWWMLRLEEETAEGRRFLTAVSVTSVPSIVSVYVTLEAGWATNRIMPVSVDPRCPKIVRELLSLPGHWYHGSSTLRQQREVTGFDEGEILAAEILHPERTVPLLVVSTCRGNLALPDLCSKLGYDLAGLANVAVVDDDASWALTDVLGPAFCCHSGGVRLYWPHFLREHDRYRHPLWTPERLRSIGDDLRDTCERFRRQLRELVFRAAALSAVRPGEIDEIRDAHGRRSIAALRQRATSLQEYQELADSYAKDNDQLCVERAALRARVGELERDVAKLENERLSLVSALRASKGGQKVLGPEILPDSESDGSEPRPPQSGEIRYYKKVHARPSHDVMVRVGDCGCNRWEGAHAADKARKGIMKLEGGATDWKAMHHCASCTGGGMWRVRW